MSRDKNLVSVEEWRAMQPKTKGSKLRNIRTVCDGIKFQSKKEARKYGELKLMKRCRMIKDFRRQVRFVLMVGHHHICDYVADFIVTHVDGREEVLDVKGRKAGVPYQLFKIKKKLMLATVGTEVKEC